MNEYRVVARRQSIWKIRRTRHDIARPSIQRIDGDGNGNAPAGCQGGIKWRHHALEVRQRSDLEFRANGLLDFRAIHEQCFVNDVRQPVSVHIQSQGHQRDVGGPLRSWECSVAPAEIDESAAGQVEVAVAIKVRQQERRSDLVYVGNILRVLEGPVTLSEGNEDVTLVELPHRLQCRGYVEISVSVEVADDRRQGSHERGAGPCHRVDRLEASVAIAQKDTGEIESGGRGWVESGNHQVKMTVVIEVADCDRVATNVAAKRRAGAKLKRPIGTAEKDLHARPGYIGDVEVAVSIEVSEHRGRWNHPAEVRLNLNGKRTAAIADHHVYKRSVRPLRTCGDQVELSVLINVQDVNA